jgi:hypothetical protein
LAFFGWLGWRRGLTRELIVAFVAVGTWVLLELRGGILVNVANLGSAALDFARAGGFSGSAEEAFSVFSDAEKVVTSDTKPAFLFVVWVAVCVLTYALTNVIIKDTKSTRNGWAMLVGMFNGLFFAVAFLPTMVALFAPESTLPETGEKGGLLSLFRSGLQLLWEGAATAWSLITPLGSMGLLILLTLVLVLAATSIRSNAKAKT